MDAFIAQNLNFSNVLAVFGVVLAFYFYFKCLVNQHSRGNAADISMAGMTDNQRAELVPIAAAPAHPAR
ncbi:hypothetical protein AGR4C_Lc80055 [Agrobacterium tumefaciens str. Kerr 14]|uniref:Uncharacterized protein n=1 Tax=Agrobacterium tumefaciens str. Kerr 14 TaxID=1183424 RepID=A0A1S7S3I2_AGRTU|nr:hypothetical protein AGR4C_Lc80055 [Agrobacterium tumefaciens str. Kerr 14]